MKPIAIFDGNSRKRLCFLQNALNISYKKTTNNLWTAEFSLPYGDPKNEFCSSMNLAEIWDVDSAGKNKYIGLFRIMPIDSVHSSSESLITYELEHVLATLLDTTMLGWHEQGNTGVYTGNVITYILSKQDVKRWVLGVCDYSHQYLYGWQDENLLSALFSVTNAFVEDDYRWEFETQHFPWTLSLRKVSEDAVTDLRYRKNINGIRKKTDPTNLMTRLYCYGYGEADNKLTIKEVNNGIPYIDSPNIGKYGIITRVWTDERFTIAAQLLQSGQAMLAALDEPVLSYEIDIATIRAAADLEAGDMVRIADEKANIYTRVIEVSKADVSGEPLKGAVILANKSTDIAQSVADMADRQRIATTYSQGAESLFADSLYDNADNANPAELMFTVPNNAVHVNEILFSARLRNFRAYSKAVQGGGSNTLSSTSGGGVYDSTYGGGGAYITSGSGGQTSSTSSQVSLPASNMWVEGDSGPGQAKHNHGMPSGPLVTGINVSTNADGVVTNVRASTIEFVPSGAHSHGAHDHVVTFSSHTHSVQVNEHVHYFQVPSHQHQMTLPNHTHAIEYGIYKGPVANQMQVRIDGVLVGTFVASVDNVNLIAYMSKNANGEIMRGQHTIQITPNSLSRIECAIQIRLFTNARGAGQY